VTHSTAPAEGPAGRGSTPRAIRQERNQLLLALRSGWVSLSAVLTRDDEIVGQIPLRRLLESLPGFGKVAAGRLMSELGLSGQGRVRQLEPAQHARLLDWSRAHCQQQRQQQPGPRARRPRTER
jgi:hypothetical protein